MCIFYAANPAVSLDNLPGWRRAVGLCGAGLVSLPFRFRRPLLEYMRQLVRQQVFPTQRAGLIETRVEVNIGLVGEGLGAQALVQAGSLLIGVDAHPAEVCSKTPFQFCQQRGRQRLAFAFLSGDLLAGLVVHAKAALPARPGLKLKRLDWRVLALAAGSRAAHNGLRHALGLLLVGVPGRPHLQMRLDQAACRLVACRLLQPDNLTRRRVSRICQYVLQIMRHSALFAARLPPGFVL